MCMNDILKNVVNNENREVSGVKFVGLKRKNDAHVNFGGVIFVRILSSRSYIWTAGDSEIAYALVRVKTHGYDSYRW